MENHSFDSSLDEMADSRSSNEFRRKLDRIAWKRDAMKNRFLSTAKGNVMTMTMTKLSNANLRKGIWKVKS